MKYYKRDNGAIYEAREIPLETSDSCIEITEEEYNAAINEINVKNEVEDEFLIEFPYVQQLEADKAELEARNAELEAENAALLFQNLTGEEFII